MANATMERLEQIPATTKQLWYLHILTKQDTRDWKLTAKGASDMINALKKADVKIKRIETATDPAKELSVGPDPITTIAEYHEIVNDDPAIETMPVTFRDSTGNEVTVNQSHYLGLAVKVAGLPDKDLPGYGMTNMAYIKRNFMFVYIDRTWRDWSISYANKLRNPDYQLEIAAQGYEIKQLSEVC
jgi:hypothetical protein